MSATRRLRVHVSRRTERFILAREGGREEAWRSAGGSVSQTRKPRPTSTRMMVRPRFPREFPLVRPSTPYLGALKYGSFCAFSWFVFRRVTDVESREPNRRLRSQISHA